LARKPALCYRRNAHRRIEAITGDEQGTIIGTFQYMSPEQIEARNWTAAATFFSLGAVLYEML